MYAPRHCPVWAEAIGYTMHDANRPANEVRDCSQHEDSQDAELDCA